MTCPCCSPLGPGGSISLAPTWDLFFVSQWYAGSVEDGGIFTPFKTLSAGVAAAAAFVAANPGSRPTVKIDRGSYGAVTITADMKLSALTVRTRGAFQNNVPFQSDVFVADIAVDPDVTLALDGISQVSGGVTFATDGNLLLSNGCGLGNILSTTPGVGISLHASDSAFGSATQLDTDVQLNNVVCLGGLDCMSTVGTPQIFLVDSSMLGGSVTFSGNAGNVNVDCVSNYFLLNTPVAIVNGTKTILEDCETTPGGGIAPLERARVLDAGSGSTDGAYSGSQAWSTFAAALADLSAGMTMQITPSTAYAAEGAQALPAFDLSLVAIGALTALPDLSWTTTDSYFLEKCVVELTGTAAASFQTLDSEIVASGETSLAVYDVFGGSFEGQADDLTMRAATLSGGAILGTSGTFFGSLINGDTQAGASLEFSDCTFTAFATNIDAPSITLDWSSYRSAFLQGVTFSTDPIIPDEPEQWIPFSASSCDSGRFLRAGPASGGTVIGAGASLAQQTVPVGGFLTRLSMSLESAAGANDLTFTVFLNQVATALAVTVPNGDTTAIASDRIAVVQGDFLEIQVTTTDGSPFAAGAFAQLGYTERE